MIEICTLKDEIEVGERGRGMGKRTRQRIVLAVDRFNLVIGTASGENPISGKQFNHRLHGFQEYFRDNDLLTEATRETICDSLSRLLDIKVKPSATYKDMDEAFQTYKRVRGSSGELELYRTLRVIVGDSETDNDEEDGEE